MSSLIPLIDIKKQYLSIKKEIDQAIGDVINDCAFIGGEYVNEFENKFSKMHDSKFCVSCGNGTDAIYITLKALGIGPGDEVITTALSWISTSETISQTGARVVFCDIEDKYFTIDAGKIERCITNKTKAIIPVHLYGHPCNMAEIMKIGKKFNIHIIEDCAQAHFAEWKNKKVGNFGVAGTFSFYPSKNLGAFGDAGAIISNNKEFIKKARIFSNHGISKRHFHDIEGINSRMDGLQAKILSIKMKHVNEWNKKRQLIFNKYNDSLEKIRHITTPSIDANVKHGFHLYVIRALDRNGLNKYLQKNGISTQIHYLNPLPSLQAYLYLGHNNNEFPVARDVCNQILSLPFYPELTGMQLEFIINCISNYYTS